ncbi:hypothetical protein P168DRAFT_277926 [Aspergillus campestris IBT 28561]|uniref:Uncharacterized protein n=1 Tax=Aspergillus campestris (strain IBT 28561) TaxID=1392248 RepID=A0A2I1DEN8_ASPC2|nr:uncharacterized protein P168DRAFT_277926 [Aspergillus campestris IBT 28561]PKY08321.1 hypothetical protein P168DRAFT_277926 [Aspergillus campestris IBT 28561]
MESSKIELWVPKDFAEEGKIYMLPANHRGDMYHIRAAMLLEPHHLLVYACSDKTKDLTGYLMRSVASENKMFLTEWSWEILSGSKDPIGTGYDKRKFEVISESNATTIIRGKINSEKDAKDLAEKMIIIDQTHKEEIRRYLESLCEKLFQTGTEAVLIQCRDTGTKGGIYPELDSGIDSVIQIAQYVGMVSQTLKVVLCGNTEKIDDLAGIGEYFKQIESSKWPSESNRDIEAFFLQIAFEKKYFSMVIGFRSGGLDLFTFLGVPSVSISVRQMVGENRHGEIARNKHLQRWNIQYELPRHVTTKYFGERHDLLGSPWWKFDKPKGPTRADQDRPKSPTREDKDKQSILPTGFHKFDSEIVKIGIHNAIVVLLKYPNVPTIKPVIQNRVFSNWECRPSHYSNTRREDLRDFFDGQREKEEDDFTTRKNDIENRREGKADFEKWENSMRQEWNRILNKRYH